MAGATRARLRKPASFKERIEQNLALFVMGVVLSSFVAGMSAYRELLSIAHLGVVSTQEIEQCKALKKQAENTHTTAISSEPGGGQQLVSVKAERASAPKPPPANPPLLSRPSKESRQVDTGVQNDRPLSRQAIYSGPVDPDIVCKRLFSAEYAGALTPSGVECRSEAETREVAASNTCMDLYGSRRFSVEPATLSLMCDTSMLTPMPCRADQRRCGLRAESCCPPFNWKVVP